MMVCPAASAAASSCIDLCKPSNGEEEELFASDEFRMYAYKILPCPKKTSHEWTTCPYAHPGEKARRRDPRQYNYLAIPCEATKQSQSCPQGDMCPFSHSIFEFWMHPCRYRTQLCRDMENGHCKRQVCFFAHSIEELRVPDHSHLNIPPEMQAAEAARTSGGSSNSSGRLSPDPSAAGSSDNSSGSSGGSTPRAGGSKGTDSSSTKTAASAESKLSMGNGQQLPLPGNSRAVNINRSSSSSSGGGVPRPARLQRGNSLHNSYSPSMQSPNMQWAGMAGTPAAAAALLGSSCGSPESACAHPNSRPQSSPLHQHQRALLHQQRQAQQGLAAAGSLYEQQLQLLIAAESAQAQHAQLMLMLQNQQAAAAAGHLSAQLSGSSMGRFGDACSISGGSPPLSPGSFLDSSPSLGDNNSNSTSSRMFVPPSASSGALMAAAAAAANWESQSLLRSLSMPAHTGMNHNNSNNNLGRMPAHGPSSFGAMGGAATAGYQSSVGPLHHSAGSSAVSIDGQQELTLASLLAAKAAGGGDGSWAASSACTPAMSLGMASTSAGFPLGSLGGQGNLGAQGAAGGFGGYVCGQSTGLDAASYFMLQQQQQQQQQMLQDKANTMQLLQALHANRGGDAGDCTSQAMGDVIGMLMQQLVLQQRPAVL